MRVEGLHSLKVGYVGDYIGYYSRAYEAGYREFITILLRMTKHGCLNPLGLYSKLGYRVRSCLFFWGSYYSTQKKECHRHLTSFNQRKKYSLAAYRLSRNEEDKEQPFQCLKPCLSFSVCYLNFSSFELAEVIKESRSTKPHPQNSNL